MQEPAGAIVTAFSNPIRRACRRTVRFVFGKQEKAPCNTSNSTPIPTARHTFDELPLKLDEADYRPPAPMVFVSHALQAGTLQFVRLPSGWAGENICPPRRKFLFCLEGQLEVRASDEKKRTFGPGDAVLMEDTSGHGHSSHVKGGKDLIAAIVALGTSNSDTRHGRRRAA